MAGAVVVVEARLPQRPPGEGVDLDAVSAGRKTQRGDGDVPLSTRVKRSRISGLGAPIGTVRVMSVVPSRYWAPESTR